MECRSQCALIAAGLLAATCAVDAGEFVKQDAKQLPAAAGCMPTPPVPPPAAASAVAFDNHGNYWTLVPTEKKGHMEVWVLPAQNARVWVRDEPSGIRPGRWCWILADEFGYVWTSDCDRVLRLDPHAPEQGWQDISADSAFPDDEVTAMCVGPSGAVMVALKRGGIAELDRVRPHRARRARNVVERHDAPPDVRQLVTDTWGNVWAKMRRDVYKREAPPDAWQRSWELVARMPSGSHDLSGDVLGGRFYMDWAVTGDFGYPSTGRIHSKLLEFDPDVDPDEGEWRAVADYGLPRGYCGVGILTGKVWTVSGAAVGADGKRYDSRLTQIFDPASDRVEAGPDLPIAIPAAIALSSGRRLYVLGFPKGRDVTLKIYSIGEGETEWRPEPDGPKGGGSWETIPAPHSPRSPAVSHCRSEIWVMGGRTNEGGQVTYIYTPASRQWRKGPPLPREIVWGAAFNIDGDLYVTGGAAGRCYNNRTFRLRAGYAGASHP
jgi:hypothetical protein